MSTLLRFPTTEFRSLPYPSGDGPRAKVASCFVRVDDLPPGLKEWMAVNPRIPTFKKEHLQDRVARAMIKTLLEEPDKFELKNQGMYLLAEDVSFEKAEGGVGVVTVTFSDRQRHGLVNGGHTFYSILEAAEDEDCPDPWNAYVRLHIMVGVDADLITDIAEGLNRSLQVDNPSLENLQGTFKEIKDHLDGKPGADKIAYRQGDPGPVDIVEVLTEMAMFDLDKYPDRKAHPNGLFGHGKEVLDRFTLDMDTDQTPSEKSVFRKVIPKVRDILVLADRIEMETAARTGRYKVTRGKKQNRVRSPRHRSQPAHFAGGDIGGHVPVGWLFPMLAAFRANVSMKAWKERRFEWIVDPSDLIKDVIGEMIEIVTQEHEDNKRKPAEVGRKEAAYRGCYGVVTLELAQRGLLE